MPVWGSLLTIYDSVCVDDDTVIQAAVVDGDGLHDVPPLCQGGQQAPTDV